MARSRMIPVKTPKQPIPSIEVTTVVHRPSGVAAEISPYPIVVKVMYAVHRPSEKVISFS